MYPWQMPGKNQSTRFHHLEVRTRLTALQMPWFKIKTFYLNHNLNLMAHNFLAQSSHASFLVGVVSEDCPNYYFCLLQLDNPNSLLSN
jgi:hypothetical protein